jgi:arylsulfatase A-like enzyme
MFVFRFVRRCASANCIILIVALLAGCNTFPTPARRPDLVLVVIDTLRADHLGSYGYARGQTPRLDGFAAAGTRFASAHAPTSWTLPSVASILTGRYPIEHGVERVVASLNDKHVTVAEVLHDAGYETAAFSANVALVIEASGFAQGFDVFRVLEVAADGPDDTDPVLVRDGTERSAQAARADLVTDQALAWLGSRSHPERPYFLYVHYFDPHVSYSPPPEYAARFGVRPDDPLWHGQGLMMLAGKPPPAPELQTLMGLYDAEIAFTDTHVGRLIDGIESARGGATVIVTSDHGEEFDDHGGLQHGRTLFEEMLHVPLLAVGSGISKGRVVDTPVSLVSIAPTLAELAGAGPAAFPPVSLAGALRGSAMTPEPIFADLALPLGTHRGAVIDGTWKLTLNRGFNASLFDLASDPHEKSNELAGQTELGRRLQKTLGDHTGEGMKKRAAAPPVSRELDDARRERLKALGYVE